MAEATIRRDTFRELFRLINTNKPSGWTVYSSFPEENPKFPNIIVNPPNIDKQKLSFSASATRIPIELTIEFFVQAKDGKIKVDEGRDNVDNTITTNESALKTGTNQKLLFQENFIEDIEESGDLLINEQKYNTGSVILRFWAVR